MQKKRVLILDYSVDRLETPTIKACLASYNLEVDSLFIDTEASFPDRLIEQGYTHIIHTGSALSINATAPFTEKAMRYIQDARDKGLWQFGICYGHQLVCKALVGDQAVRSSPNGFEVGWLPVTCTAVAKSLLGVRDTEQVWQHHFDEVTQIPEGSELLATSVHSPIQAYVNHQHHVIGTQFHPEFHRETGNAYLLTDRKFITKQGIDVDELIADGPSIDAAAVFFGWFLEQEAAF